MLLVSTPSLPATAVPKPSSRHGLDQQNNDSIGLPVCSTHHTGMVEEDEAASNAVQHCLDLRQRLQQDVSNCDDCLAQQ